MAKATFIIEDSATEGCVNMHWDFGGPDLDETSPAHQLMSRVLLETDKLVKTAAADNLKGAIRAKDEADTSH